MPLSNDQELTLLLAGTVGLPSPPPATGTVDVVTVECRDAATPSDLYLRVTHRVGSRMTLVRTVRLTDVRVIRAVWPDQEEDAHPVAKTPREFLPLAEAQARPDGANSPWLTKAVLYVLEAAPVLLQVEVGMTAAESADYYPPVDGGGRMPGGGLGAGDGGARVGRRKGQFLKEFLGARGATQVHRPEGFFEFNPCTPIPVEPPDIDQTQ